MSLYLVEESDVCDALRKLLQERGITTELASFLFAINHDGDLITYVRCPSEHPGRDDFPRVPPVALRNG